MWETWKIAICLLVFCFIKCSGQTLSTTGTTCFGISATSSKVCSGTGSCIGQDMCSCSPSFEGSECEWNVTSKNIYCWGTNAIHDLGDADSGGWGNPWVGPDQGNQCNFISSTTQPPQPTADVYTPILISASSFNGSNLQFMKAGASHSVIVTYSPTSSLQQIYTWGSNNLGQLGTGSNSTTYSIYKVPMTAFGSKMIMDVGAGWHTVVLLNDGSLVGWGTNLQGQLAIKGQPPGPNIAVSTTSLSPYSIFVASPTTMNTSAVGNVSQIFVGSLNTFVINSDGVVWAVGSNDYCQLGIGDATCANSSVAIYTVGQFMNVKLRQAKIIEIAPADYHTVFLDNNGDIYTVGVNYYDQLGVNNTNDIFYTPTKVTPYPSGVFITRIISTAIDVLALDSSGNVWAYGFNGGSFGIQDFTNQTYVAQNISMKVHTTAPIVDAASGDGFIIYKLSDESLISSYNGPPDYTVGWNNSAWFGVQGVAHPIAPFGSFLAARMVSTSNQHTLVFGVTRNCTYGRIGPSCNDFICYGYGSGTQGVCSGKGKCIGYNLCSCEQGYGGDECSEVMCNGTLAGPTACNSNGNCTGPNICICKSGYIGQYCAIPICYTILANNATVCSGNGNCVAPDNCTCNSGYAGTQCGTYTCQDILSTELNVCSGYGACIGVDLCSCLSGYSGSVCQIPPQTTTQIPTLTATQMPTVLITQTSIATQIPTILTTQAASLIVTPTPTTTTATPTPTTTAIQMPTTSTTEFTSTAVSLPVAIINIPPVIGVCDGLALDGSLSFDISGSPLTYIWSVAEGTNSAEVNDFLKSNNQAYITVPASLLFAGSKYIFSLQVINYMQQNSTIAVASVYKSSLYQPIASIIGPSVQNTTTTRLFILQGTAASSATCLSANDLNNYQIQYTWSQISGPVSVQSIAKGPYLYFPPGSYSLNPDGSAARYIFQLTTSLKQDPAVNNTASVMVIVYPQPLYALIVGGMYRTISVMSTLTLDGSYSYDPENVNTTMYYYWTCSMNIDSNYPCPFGSSWSDMIVTIPAGSTVPDMKYYFTLTISKGNRSSKASIIIQTSNLQVPMVSILPLSPPIVNRNTKVVLRGSASLPNSSYDSTRPHISLMKYQWSILYADGSIMDDAALLNSASSAVNSTIMIIEAHILKANQSYFVQFNVTNLADGSSALSQIQFTVNTPPVAGQFLLFPSSGPLTTQFMFTCTQWRGSFPLTYEFGYYHSNNRIPVTSNPITSNIFSALLPAGSGVNGTLNVYAAVFDQYGASTIVNSTVSVTVPQTLDIFQWIQNQTQGDLQTALSSDNIDQATQIAQVIVNTMNSLLAKEISSSDETMGFSCPNNCSGNGICKSGSLCECESLWGGIDCSLSQDILRQRQSLRESLLISVSSTNNQTASTITQQTLLQQVLLTKSITDNPAELNNQTQLIASNLALQFSSQVKSNFDSRTVQAIGSIISNIVTSAIINNPTKDHGIVSILYKSIGTLLSSVHDNKVAGEKPTAIQDARLSIIAYRNFGNSLRGVQLSTLLNSQSTSNYIQLSLPESYNTTSNTRSFLDSDEIFLSASSFAKDPYYWSSSSANISSPIFSLTFQKSVGGKQVSSPLQNLASPISFVLSVNPGSFQLGGYNSNTSLPGFRPQCQYWDVSAQNWSTVGCAVISFTDNNITCGCTHTTDFAAFWSYVDPHLNLLTLKDIENIKKLNPDNMLTVYVVSGLAGGYLLLVGLLLLMYMLTRFGLFKRFESKGASVNEGKAGRLRKVLRGFRDNHLYLSFIFVPDTERSKYFVRIERLTIIYISILGMFASNAISFKDTQQNEIQFIAAVVLSNIIVSPFVFFIFFLLQKTADVVLVKTSKVSFDATIVEDFNQTESKEKKVTISNEYDENAKSPGLVDNIMNSANRIIDIVDDFVDKLVIYIQRNLLRLSIQGVFIVLFVTLSYFLILAGVVFLLPTAFSFITDIDQWIVGCIGVSIFVLFLWYLFFYVRMEKYRDGTLKLWRMTKIKMGIMIVFTVVAIIVSIAICVLTILFVPSTSVWNTRLIIVTSFIGAHTLLMLIMTIVLSINVKKKGNHADDVARVYPIAYDEEKVDSIHVLHHKYGNATKKAALEIINAQEREEYEVYVPEKESLKLHSKKSFFTKLWDKLKQDKWFPRWFVIVDYLLVAVFAGLTSFVLILYGIKFDSTAGTHSMAQDMQWLLGSGISVGAESFIANPLIFFVKAVIYVALIQLMRGLMFPSAPKEEKKERVSSGRPRMRTRDIIEKTKVEYFK